MVGQDGVKLGVKDLRLGTVLPNREPPFTIYMMVTTFVPALSQRIYALAHGLLAAHVYRDQQQSCILPSCAHLSVFQPSTG